MLPACGKARLRTGRLDRRGIVRANRSGCVFLLRVSIETASLCCGPRHVAPCRLVPGDPLELGSTVSVRLANRALYRGRSVDTQQRHAHQARVAPRAPIIGDAGVRGRTKVARQCKTRRHAPTAEGQEAPPLRETRISRSLFTFMARRGRRFESARALCKNPAKCDFCFRIYLHVLDEGMEHFMEVPDSRRRSNRPHIRSAPEHCAVRERERHRR